MRSALVRYDTTRYGLKRIGTKSTTTSDFAPSHDSEPAIYPAVRTPFNLTSHSPSTSTSTTPPAMNDPTTFPLPSPLLLLSLLLPLLSIPLIYADYTTFLSLGPGGTPPTPTGYLKIKLLSLITLRNPYLPPPLPPHFRPQSGVLTPLSIPLRPGARPLVKGIAPQRQRTQRSSPGTYNLLLSELRAVVRASGSALTERTSCFETHSSGIFATTPILRTRCGGEICHAHAVDGSLHLVLHPADAGVVLERGWGERHPLARGGWCRRFVPKEFVLVYAPRTEGEVKVVMEIVRAGVWWVAGMEVDGREKGECRGEGDAACGMCSVHGGGEEVKTA